MWSYIVKLNHNGSVVSKIYLYLHTHTHTDILLFSNKDNKIDYFMFPVFYLGFNLKILKLLMELITYNTKVYGITNEWKKSKIIFGGQMERSSV